MQNKNIKNQSQVRRRRLHGRVGVALLLSAILLGVTTLSHDARNVLREIALKPAVAMISNCGRENETARLPVQYDNVLKLQTNSGR